MMQLQAVKLSMDMSKMWHQVFCLDPLVFPVSTVRAHSLQEHRAAAKNNYRQWLLGTQPPGKLRSLGFPILTLINDLASHKTQCYL